MQKYKSWLLLGLPILITIIASYFLQYKVLSNQEALTNWLEQFGPFVLVVYVLLQALSIIIAPIGGFFLVVAMMALYGEGVAITLAYFVTVPCYILNFLLARKYGRPLVTKIVGKEALEKMDHYVADAGTPTLVMTRILQASNFDYLSYGWGLTKVDFKTYIIVNILAGIPGSLMTYLVFARFENLAYGLILFYLITSVFTALTIYITHKRKSHSK